MMQYDANKKSTLVAYLLWWFMGMFGAHRSYLGSTSGAAAILIITLLSIPLMLVVIGCFTICISAAWVLIDVFLIPGMTRAYNSRLATKLSGPAL